MLDYAQIVEEIQSAIGSTVPPDWDLLRDTASEYVAACDEVNLRLVECAGLLKKGLRSEALQAAEREPNVLDSVGILDFPELPEWHKALSEQGIVLPPAIKNEIAGDLNTAYFSATPLTGLMRSHRLLALARAPLAQRIGVMRQIRDLDLDNPIWDQDLRVYESARMREIPKELAAASSAKDANRVTGLAFELEAPGWLISPPADLVARTRKIVRSLAADSATAELREIEKKLSNAHSALDEDAGFAQKARWDKLMATAQLAQDDPLVARAAPAIHWLNRLLEQRRQQDEYAGAIAQLEDSLDRDADRRTLERAYQAMHRLDAELPELLERRYVERIRSLDAADKRRFVLLLSGVIGALAIAASVTLWIILRTHHENQVASSTAAMSKLVESGNLVEARKYADSIAVQSKSIAVRPVFIEQVTRLEGLEREEKVRTERFLELLSRLEQMDDNAPERSLLSEAEKLAKTDTETAKVAAIRARVRSADVVRQKEIDTQFDKRYRELLASVAEMGGQLERGTPVDTKVLSELRQAIQRLGDTESKPSIALSSQVEPLLAKAAVLTRVNNDLISLRQTLDGLSSKIGKPQEFGAGLSELAKNHAAMASFKLVAEEANLWSGAQAWHQLVHDFAVMKLLAMGPKEAAAILARADALAKDHPMISEPPFFVTKRGLLEGISKRESSEGQLQLDLLQRSFEGRIMTGLWLVKGIRFSPKGSEERFYTDADPIPPGVATEARLAIHVINSLDLAAGNDVRLDREGLIAKPAPQVQLSKDVIAIIQVAKKGDWDTSMLEILTVLLSSKYEDLDPLLRFITFSRVLEVGRDGSHAIKVAFEPIWQIVQDANVDSSANWLIWNEKQAASSRAEATTSFKAILARFPEAKERFAKQLELDRIPIEPAPKWIGWIRPDGKQLRVDPGRNPPIDGKLFVLAPPTAPANEKAEWIPVGESKSGAMTLQPSTSLAAGRPIFILPDVSSK